MARPKPQSMLDMHPEEFAQRDAAWSVLKQSENIRIEDVRACLEAERNIHRAINYGRKDANLELACELLKFASKILERSTFSKMKFVPGAN